MVYLHGLSNTEPNGTWEYAPFPQFMAWVKGKTVLQVDTETTVTSSIVERELKLVQIGDVYGQHQWLFQWEGLNQGKRNFIGKLMEDTHILKVIQNVSFEYQIFRKQGYFLTSVWDTMLAEKVLHTGLDTPPGFNGLASILKRRWGLDLSKAEQTTFGDGELDDERIRYGALDVKYLGALMMEQRGLLQQEGLENVAALEFETVLALAEIEYTGMLLDQEAWRGNISLAEPIIQEHEEELNDFLRGEEFREGAIQLGFLAGEDSYLLPWSSPRVRQELLQLAYPDLPGATKPIVEKYLKGIDSWEGEPLRKYLEKDYSQMEAFLKENYLPLLQERGWFTPKGKVLINWASPVQRLQLFQLVAPDLKGTSKEELAKSDHPIIEAYQGYINATKLVTSFGEKFLTDSVDSDGRVRTRFNQIINTGRMSSSGPNLQQIPANEKVGNAYRNCFIEEPGWLFVDSDFGSQELVMLAFFSKDPVWAEALAKNQDLHSVCAEQVFGVKWKEAAQEGCGYYQVLDNGEAAKQKCKCKAHKSLRTLVKTINFMLAYGGSKHKLSSTAKISLEEAQQTIDDYFLAFPGIQKTLDAFGNYGVKKGHMVTPPPFSRKRYYGDWKPNLDRWEASKIDRQSRNTPIQGGAADITKLALVLTYQEIKTHNLWDKVRLVACVHDQITTTCQESVAEEWKVLLHQSMLDAALVVIPSGQLGAETMVTYKWSK